MKKKGSPITPLTSHDAYRPWIEAGKRNLARHITEKKAHAKARQAEFLTIVEQVYFETVACEALQLNPNIARLWSFKSPDFKTKLIEAKEKGRELLADRLNAQAYTLAFYGWERPIYQKGVLVGKERVFSPSLIEMVSDRLARGSWAISPNAITVNANGPAAVQINLGSAETRRAHHPQLPESSERD